ncbi:MAG: hypothetical protein AVW06_03830 [Hadesarchaea archaeon DG-33-1]|nr:MAG: hypothetical protein AVW06_03830 [Hadesarchaea archaeon DG-33-1]
MKVKPLNEVIVIGKTTRGGRPFSVRGHRGMYFFILVEQFDWLKEVNDAYKTLYRGEGVEPLERIKIVGRGGVKGYRPFLLKGHYGRYLCVFAKHLRQLEQINCAYAELLEAKEWEEERKRKLEERERASKIVESVKAAVEDARKTGAPEYAAELMRCADKSFAEIEAAFAVEEYDRVLELASKVDELVREARAKALKKIEETKKIEAVKIPPEEGRYVYCIIPWEGRHSRLSFGDLGVEGNSEVYAIPFGDIAAVVSNAPFKEYVLTEDNIRTHNQVITLVMQKYPVVPMAFGMAFKNEGVLKGLLERVRGDLKNALNEVEGKVELGVKVTLPEGTEFDENAFASKIKALRELATQCKLGKRFSKRLILNAFYLVAKEKVEAFLGAAKALEEKFKQLSIQCTGPWPPFNFATIKVGGR